MRPVRDRGGTPHFGMWATGVGGVVRKKGAGDGGFLYQNIHIYLKGGLCISPQTCAHKINKHTSKHKQYAQRHSFLGTISRHNN